MPKRTPAEAAAKWKTNLTAATTEIELGVNKVTVAPGMRAVQQKSKMISKWMESMDNGSWERNTAAVTLPEWRDAMINRGIRRIRDGADKGSTKLNNYFSKAFPLLQQLEAQIDAMPKNDMNDSLERVRALMVGMRNISTQVRGG